MFRIEVMDFNDTVKTNFNPFKSDKQKSLAISHIFGKKHNTMFIMTDIQDQILNYLLKSLDFWQLNLSKIQRIGFIISKLLQLSKS